jgi:hypothetical protein
MRTFIVAATTAAALMLPQLSESALASSPVFGSAKVTALSKHESSQVTAKGGTTAYYLYYGLNYASSAIYYAGLAQYYNYYGYNGSNGTTTNYAYNAYYYSYYSTQNFYNAYYYSYYGQ